MTGAESIIAQELAKLALKYGSKKLTGYVTSSIFGGDKDRGINFPALVIPPSDFTKGISLTSAFDLSSYRDAGAVLMSRAVQIQNASQEAFKQLKRFGLEGTQAYSDLQTSIDRLAYPTASSPQEAAQRGQEAINQLIATDLFFQEEVKKRVNLLQNPIVNELFTKYAEQTTYYTDIELLKTETQANLSKAPETFTTYSLAKDNLAKVTTEYNALSEELYRIGYSSGGDGTVQQRNRAADLLLQINNLTTDVANLYHFATPSIINAESQTKAAERFTDIIAEFYKTKPPEIYTEDVLKAEFLNIQNDLLSKQDFTKILQVQDAIRSSNPASPLLSLFTPIDNTVITTQQQQTVNNAIVDAINSKVVTNQSQIDLLKQQLAQQQALLTGFTQPSSTLPATTPSQPSTLAKIKSGLDTASTVASIGATAFGIGSLLFGGGKDNNSTSTDDYIFFQGQPTTAQDVNNILVPLANQRASASQGDPVQGINQGFSMFLRQAGIPILLLLLILTLLKGKKK